MLRGSYTSCRTLAPVGVSADRRATPSTESKESGRTKSEFNDQELGELIELIEMELTTFGEGGEFWAETSVSLMAPSRPEMSIYIDRNRDLCVLMGNLVNGSTLGVEFTVDGRVDRAKEFARDLRMLQKAAYRPAAESGNKRPAPEQHQ